MQPLPVYALNLKWLYFNSQTDSRLLWREKSCKLSMSKEIFFDHDIFRRCLAKYITSCEYVSSNWHSLNSICFQRALKACRQMDIPWIQFAFKELWGRCIWDFGIGDHSKYLKYKQKIIIENVKVWKYYPFTMVCIKHLS